MYSPHPGIIGIIITEKYTLTFSIFIFHLLTFSSRLILAHQCKGPEKNFCQV
jgi:hypothetical protein